MEEKQKRLPKKTLALFILLAVVIVVAVAAALVVSARNRIKYVKTDGHYSYINDDPRRATPDDGFSIDGVFDEEAYKDCKWLYLHNDNGDASVDLAMTTYYGEKGVYFAFDDTESTSVWVNPNRETTMNSAIEMYLAPAGVKRITGEEDVFEIDLLPNGIVNFKKRAGNDSWVNVRSSNDIMAYLGTTLKGGELDTGDCHGYTMEFFIPWDYLDYLGLDVKAIKESHLMVNPVHITSYNYKGADSNADRYWYPFTRQIGGDGWDAVSRYFRFNKAGVLDTVPVNLVEGEHYTISGSTTVYPHLNAYVTIKPEEGYAIQSVLSNGEEKIRKVSYNEDGSALVVLRGPEDANGLTVSAVAEAITDGKKTLNGTVNLNRPGGDSFEKLSISCKGPDGNVKIKIDENGNFQLKDLKQGFYTIKASKDGYTKATKGIYLKRNVDVDIDLNYEMFEVQSGYSWNIDEQAESKLVQWGGEGKIITVNSYDNFYMEANIKYDEEETKISDDDQHTEQRTGIRIQILIVAELDANS